MRSIHKSFVSGVLLALGTVASAQDAVQLKISAQPLGYALAEFAQQTGLQLIASSELTQGLKTEGLEGRFTAEEGLKRLLAEAGLGYDFINERTVAIRELKRTGTVSKPVAQVSQEGGLRLAQANTASSQAGVPPTSQASSDQQNGSESADQSQGVKLEEIVVTAQKRTERLQDVPVPVTAVDARALAESNSLRLRDFYTRVPSLTVTPTTQSNQFVVLRGITTGSGNPSVGVTVDDVPYGSYVGLGGGNTFPELDPGDLERVEVLRGPQGTLYGASSMGGLIKFVTRAPSTEQFSARIQGGINGVADGDDVGYNIRASANAPLNEAFAVRASAFHQRSPGYIDNVQAGKSDVNWEEGVGGRLAALWKISDTFSLQLSALMEKGTGGGTPESDVTLGDLEQSRLIDTGDFERTRQVYSAVLVGQLGVAELTSVTGYSINKASDEFDSTYNLGAVAQAVFGVGGMATFNDLEAKKFTQELRLAFPLGERLDALLGGFFNDEDNVFQQNLIAINPATGAHAGLFLYARVPTTIKEYAGFANLTYHVTDRFEIQLGARQSQITPTQSQTVISGGVETVLTGVEQKQDSFTYLLTPQFRLSPDLMVYARLASGYRAGGLNYVPPVNPGNLVPGDYESDSTENYEVGLKGSFLDGMLSVDASIYYIDWKDLQLTLRTPVAPVVSYITNAGSAVSKGAELALEARPLQGLTITGWVAWNDATLAENLPATSSVTGLDGDRLPYSSRFSGRLSVEQSFPLSSGRTGFIGGVATRIGDRRGRFLSGSAIRETFPNYETFDFNAGLRSGLWTAALFINNATDERGVLTGGTGASPPFAFTYIQPRTFGLSLSKLF